VIAGAIIVIAGAIIVIAGAIIAIASVIIVIALAITCTESVCAPLDQASQPRQMLGCGRRMRRDPAGSAPV
jgi:hypothetical protein